MGSANIMKNDVTNLWRAPHVGAPTTNGLRRTTYDQRPTTNGLRSTTYGFSKHLEKRCSQSLAGAPRCRPYDERPTTNDLQSTSAFAARFGQPMGNVEGRLAFFELPMPVAIGDAGRVHASRRRQGQEVLHGDDDCFGPAAVGIGDEGADDFLRCRFIGHS